MATEPSELPRWATDGTNNDEPTEGRKDTGFLAPSGSPAVGDVPTSDEFNWYMNLVYQWLLWMRDQPVIVHASSGHAGGAVTPWTVDNTIGDVIKTSTNLAALYVPIDIPVGSSYTNARFRVKPNGATNTVLCYIVHATDDVIDASVGPIASTGGSAWEDVDVATTITRATANQRVYAVIGAGGGGAGERRASLIEVTK